MTTTSNSINKAFLLDAAGALISTLLLGVLLPYYKQYIGLPLNLLYILATIATVLFAFAIYCFLTPLKHPIVWLKLLAIFNLCYVFSTLFLLWPYRQQLTPLGYLYFIIELCILGLLIKYEWKSSLK